MKQEIQVFQGLGISYDLVVKEFIVAREVSDLPVNRKGAALVLGNLDGLHCGHQELILRARKAQAGLAFAFTFDPHPLEILRPEANFQRIFPQKTQIELLRRMGLDGVYFQKFDQSFAATSAEDFLEKLWQLFEPSLVVVGFNFHFGQGRRGGPELLKSWAEQKRESGFDVKVDIVEPIQLDGQTVSSSEIRKAVREGRVAHARKLLGFPFFVETYVEPGAKRGRVIGFPTANMSWPQNILVPHFGVYATRAIIDGKHYPAVSHLGPVPTFSDSRPRLETHLLDVQMDLYGKEIAIEFFEMLREPQKFDGLESLKAQIQQDIIAARKVHDHVSHP